MWSEAFAAAWVQFHPEAVYCTYCLCPAFLSSLYSPNIKKNGYKPEKYILNDTCNPTEFNLIFLLSYSGPFTDFHMTFTG